VTAYLWDSLICAGFPRLQISENWSLCSLAGERAYCIAVRPFLTDIEWTEELTTILPSTLRLFGVVVISSLQYQITSELLRIIPSVTIQ
jgi:hypothetical protein